MLFSKRILLISLLFILFLGGCGENLYDNEDIYSFHEALSDISKGADLLNSMDKAGIEQTILVGSYAAYFSKNEKPDYNSTVKVNELLFEALAQAPNRIAVFPLLNGSEENLLAYANELLDKGARGFVIPNGVARFALMRLDDKRLQPLYAWCELHRVPLLFLMDGRIDTNPDFLPSLEQVLRDYPNMYAVVPYMLDMTNDLPRLTIMLERYPGLLLDISFGLEEEKLGHLQNLSNSRKEAKDFFDKYRDRLLFGLNTPIMPGPGRNVDWISQYYLDFRRFFERSGVRLKLLLNGKATLTKLNGMDLSDETLGFLYNHNYENLINKHPAEYKKYNLDKLLINFPSNATYSEKASYRLVTTLVTGYQNPTEGMFSAWLKSVLAGQVTNWREIAGVDLPIHVIAIKPLDQWLIKRLAVEKPIAIEIVANADEIAKRLEQDPGTLAIMPFGDLQPTMKVIPIDGESPTGRYVRDCSKRGGATIGTYFYSYPLLIPLELEEEQARNLMYDPYEIRHLLYSGFLLPGGSLSAVNQDLDSASEAVFKIGALVRQSDFAIMNLPYPITDSCSAADCLSSGWLSAFDFMGIDLATAIGIQTDAEGQLATSLKRHSVDLLGMESVWTFAIRNQKYSLINVKVDADKLSQPVSEEFKNLIQKNLSDSNVIVTLQTTQQNPTPEIEQFVHEVIDAGAGSVIVAGYKGPKKITFYHGKMIAFGLGNVMLADPAQAGSDVAFMIRYVFYRDRMISIDLQAVQLRERKIHPLHALEGRRAVRAMLPQSK